MNTLPKIRTRPLNLYFQCANILYSMRFWLVKRRIRKLSTDLFLLLTKTLSGGGLQRLCEINHSLSKCACPDYYRRTDYCPIESFFCFCKLLRVAAR